MENIGGFASLVTMITAVIAGLWARRELQRAREHHAFERKVDGVRASLQLLFKLNIILEMSPGGFGQRVKDETFTVLMSMASVLCDARLFLKGPAREDLLESLQLVSQLAPVLGGQVARTDETDRSREELSALIRKVTKQLEEELSPT